MIIMKYEFNFNVRYIHIREVVGEIERYVLQFSSISSNIENLGTIVDIYSQNYYAPILFLTKYKKSTYELFQGSKMLTMKQLLVF
jgi:hypothetical protein